jgi:Tfp pilus assembly protein PilO
MRSLQKQIGWCTRIQWVTTVAFAAGIAAFVFLAYRPANDRLETMQLRIESRQRELDQNRNRTRDLRYLESEVQQLEAQLRHGRQFPRQPEIGEFIRDITQISQAMALRGWRYQHGLPRRATGYYEMPIEMHFEGDGLNVVSFLRQLEDLQRLTRVQKLTMRGKDTTAGTVEVALTMSIYFAEE